MKQLTPDQTSNEQDNNCTRGCYKYRGQIYTCDIVRETQY